MQLNRKFQFRYIWKYFTLSNVLNAMAGLPFHLSLPLISALFFRIPIGLHFIIFNVWNVAGLYLEKMCRHIATVSLFYSHRGRPAVPSKIRVHKHNMWIVSARLKAVQSVDLHIYMHLIQWKHALYRI